MSDFIESDAKCPFYNEFSTKRQFIKCEGIRKGTAINLNFANKAELLIYFTSSCCRDYENCRIAKMLYAKYEEED